MRCDDLINDAISRLPLRSLLLGCGSWLDHVQRQVTRGRSAIKLVDHALHLLLELAIHDRCSRVQPVQVGLRRDSDGPRPEQLFSSLFEVAKPSPLGFRPPKSGRSAPNSPGTPNLAVARFLARCGICKILVVLCLYSIFCNQFQMVHLSKL